MNPEKNDFVDIFSTYGTIFGAPTSFDSADLMDFFALNGGDLFNDIFGKVTEKVEETPVDLSSRVKEEQHVSIVPKSRIERQSPSVSRFYVRKDRKNIDALCKSDKSPHNPDDDDFYAACIDPKLTLNPHKLGFAPASYWPDEEYTFGDIVEDFFRRKNHPNSRFSHKVYNALQISEKVPHLRKFIGLSWLSNTVMRVENNIFGRLIGITSIAGGLFHRQGNFTSHGFIDAPASIVRMDLGPDYIIPSEKDNYRLLIHSMGMVYRGCTEDDIAHCKWAQTYPRKDKGY